MIPIRDLNPTRTKPYVNYALIAANVLVWLWEYALIQAGASWVIPGYGMVPARLVADPGGEGFTILTSMFMHGGWSHIAFNMLFLYIFGDNIEDALGHYRYLLFYLAGGLAAALAQMAIDPGSHIPMVGASGAIAAFWGRTWSCIRGRPSRSSTRSFRCGSCSGCSSSFPPGWWSASFSCSTCGADWTRWAALRAVVASHSSRTWAGSSPAW